MKKLFFTLFAVTLLTACGAKVDLKIATLEDAVIVESPRINESVQSPLVVSGEARGIWFFEGVFPIQLLGENGEELATVPATSNESWMTEDFIPFEATLVFDSGLNKSGFLVLQKDNPSGLAELDESLVIPIKF